ncbi:hypothetical protein BDZ90DRAFT_281601 [Jaminaea rosea]|uniref:Uncharacterized protein n=1 Tax=Jaminaea rosea TaxID=1569628 RepID=A0A316UKQ9_9BASI|nr:hypothetical protein BDZ90DRAFT_281601 [Jaminaea rosea]PWN25388.1 hypothetical protein BDZ90DRAFT_281601 [Jaminaea rosea]
MRFTLLLISAAALALTVSATPLDPELHQLAARGACSGGINVCCSSSSVSCSGNVCKACCNGTCGCFYSKGSSCGSNFPCTDVTKPDFATTNGQCTAPSGGNTGSTGGSTGSTGSTSSRCARLSPALRRFFNC